MDEQTRAFIAGLSVGRRLRGRMSGGGISGGGESGGWDMYSGILELPGFVLTDPSTLTVSGILALPGKVVAEEA